MQDFVDVAEGRDVRQSQKKPTVEDQEWLKANPIAWTKDRSELKNNKSN